MRIILFLSILCIFISINNGLCFDSGYTLATASPTQTLASGGGHAYTPSGREPKIKAIKKDKTPKKAAKKRYQQQSSFEFSTFFLVWLLCIVGGVFFPVGIVVSLTGLWIAGLVLLSIAVLLTLLLVISYRNVLRSQSHLAPIISAIEIVGALVLLFLFGGIFLVWGLVIAAPLAWVVGAGLLFFALLFLLVFMLMLRKNQRS